MRKIRVISLLSAAPLALLSQPALAQDNAADGAADDVIIVYGQGQTRQVQEITNDDVSILLPGTSVIRAIEKLPSVNIQSADAFGNYEWSDRKSVV